MLNRLNLVLAIAFATVLALLLLARVNHSLPNYQVELGDDMTYSPAYTSFEANDVFANGRTMQTAVPGTIRRGAKTLRYEATPQDALRAGEQLANPFDKNSPEAQASAERGKALFQFFCTTCHGSGGAGDGPVAKRGFPPPPSLLTGKSRAMKDGQLLHILTFGQNSMPNFAAQLPPDRRWDVINHIRRLQEAAGPASAESPQQELENQAPPAGNQKVTTLPEINPAANPGSALPTAADTESKP